MKINVTVELLKVTPELAAEWLAHPWPDQRKIRRGWLNRIISDMEAGRFHIGPDAILRIKGKLANGQHRLRAIIESGKAQVFLVMTSNDEELYKVIDAGLRRTASDGLVGLSYHNNLPPIARWVQAYDSGNLRASARGGFEAGASGGRNAPSQAEIIDYCRDNQEILIEAAAFVSGLYARTRVLPLSIGGALYVISSTHGNGHLEKAKEFLEEAYTAGGKSAAGDLHNRLVANKGAKAKMNLGYVFGITLKAFKCYYNGTRPGVLKWAKDEPFPAI